MPMDVSPLDTEYQRRLASGKPLTGRVVLTWLVGSFVVVFAANFALIYIALTTLHGEEVENSYDASQVYNQKLAAARAQGELGWTVNLTTRPENGGVRVVADVRDRAGLAAPGLDVRVKFLHPIDRFADREARLDSNGAEYEGFASDLHPGRWTLDFEAKLNGERKFFSENKFELSSNTE